MSNKLTLFVLGLLFFATAASAAEKTVHLESRQLEAAVGEYVQSLVEVREIRKEVRRSRFYPKALRVWLGGGGVVRVIQLVEAYLAKRSKGGAPEGLPGSLKDLLSVNQDIDLYYSGIESDDDWTAKELQQHLQVEFPYMIAEKSRWEMNPLPVFSDSKQQGGRQNTDLLSLGLIQVYSFESTNSPIVSSLNAKGAKDVSFLKSLQARRNTYIDRPTHAFTARARSGKNPKVVSAIKYVVNCLRFSVSCDFKTVEKIIKDFKWTAKSANAESGEYVAGRIAGVMTDSMTEVPDLKLAVQTYQNLGLIDLMKKIQDDQYEGGDFNRYVRLSATHEIQSFDYGRTHLPSVPLNDVHPLPNLAIIEGSRDHGGALAPLFVNMEGFDGKMLLAVRDALDEVNADYQKRVDAALFFLGNVIRYDSDLIENIGGVFDEEYDCRAHAYVSKIVAETLGVRVVINSTDRHTASLWEVKKGGYAEISRYHVGQGGAEYEALRQKAAETGVRRNFGQDDFVVGVRLPRAAKPEKSWPVGLKEITSDPGDLLKITETLNLMDRLGAKKVFANVHRISDTVLKPIFERNLKLLSREQASEDEDSEGVADWLWDFLERLPPGEEALRYRTAYYRACQEKGIPFHWTIDSIEGWNEYLLLRGTDVRHEALTFVIENRAGWNRERHLDFIKKVLDLNDLDSEDTIALTNALRDSARFGIFDEFVTSDDPKISKPAMRILQLFLRDEPVAVDRLSDAAFAKLETGGMLRFIEKNLIERYKQRPEILETIVSYYSKESRVEELEKSLRAHEILSRVLSEHAMDSGIFLHENSPELTRLYVYAVGASASRKSSPKDSDEFKAMVLGWEYGTAAARKALEEYVRDSTQAAAIQLRLAIASDRAAKSQDLSESRRADLERLSECAGIFWN